MIWRVTSRLALTLGYFVIVTPVALLRRLFAGDPLRHEVGDMGYWLVHRPADGSAEEMRKQS